VGVAEVTGGRWLVATLRGAAQAVDAVVAVPVLVVAVAAVVTLHRPFTARHEAP
jgi:hypothetical protein